MYNGEFNNFRNNKNSPLTVAWGYATTNGEQNLAYTYNSYYAISMTYLMNKSTTTTEGVNLGVIINYVSVIKSSLSSIRIMHSLKSTQTGVNWITIGY